MFATILHDVRIPIPHPRRWSIHDTPTLWINNRDMVGGSIETDATMSWLVILCLGPNHPASNPFVIPVICWLTCKPTHALRFTLRSFCPTERVEIFAAVSPSMWTIIRRIVIRDEKSNGVLPLMVRVVGWSCPRVDWKIVDAVFLCEKECERLFKSGGIVMTRSHVSDLVTVVVMVAIFRMTWNA